MWRHHHITEIYGWDNKEEAHRPSSTSDSLLQQGLGRNRSKLDYVPLVLVGDGDGGSNGACSTSSGDGVNNGG